MTYEPWQPGMKLSANRLLSISPTWSSWTPTWSTTTGANTPSFGNATLDCAYAVSATTVWWRMDIVFGSTTNFGGGSAADNWQFTLPVTAASAVNAAGAVELSFSGNARVVARSRLLSTTQMGLEISSGKPDGTAVANSGLVDLLSPFTWASGNSIRGVGHYEAAA
ncbi:hypothetical protein JS756_03155 [Streptomyces actuosus]|uniref:Uncharacterized protein n=1 Tax=Streptomyces actuosus TaxID=1885 RepID=A0ABS2VJ79_STRAS|nr:hypothetical protein [Streptomyces actuosus]MBN0043128.1 hypothetical protein [Streptomyces actuosus]